jgi:hypothetical protein
MRSTSSSLRSAAVRAARTSVVQRPAASLVAAASARLSAAVPASAIPQVQVRAFAAKAAPAAANKCPDNYNDPKYKKYVKSVRTHTSASCTESSVFCRHFGWWAVSEGATTM